MSDWMFDDGSAGALLNQDYTPPLQPVWDEPEPQGAPSQDPAFGDDPPIDDLDPVISTGYSGGGSNSSGGGGGGAGGGNLPTDTTWLDPEGPGDDLPCTPPPDGPTPTGVDMDDLRDIAADLAREIYNKTNNHPNSAEYGGFIYQMPDGSLHSSTPFTSDSEGELDVRLGRGTVPEGGRIVAWVHSHPDGGGVDQNRISQRDVQVLNAIADIEPDSAAARSYGWSGDPNVMAYIVEVGGDGDGDVSEYHETDHAGRPGAILGGCHGG